jgi:hypothetical protein
MSSSAPAITFATENEGDDLRKSRDFSRWGISLEHTLMDLF